jgi:hypothetical protein
MLPVDPTGAMPIRVVDIAFSGPSALLLRHRRLEEKRFCRRRSPWITA